MKRLPWRLLLICAVAIVGLLAYLYYQRWSQALGHLGRAVRADGMQKGVRPRRQIAGEHGNAGVVEQGAVNLVGNLGRFS